MLLSDVDILASIEALDLSIKPFDRAQLQPASYDLAVGEEAITAGGPVDLKRQGFVSIARGSSAVIATREILTLGTKLAGHYGLRSKLAREGLVLLSGPQVDPGFRGILTVTVFNSGVEDVSVRWGETFATIEFVYLKTESSQAYAGDYQQQEEIPAAEKERMGQSTAKSFSEIEQSLSRLEAQLGVLFSTVITIFVGVLLGGVVGGLIGFLVGRL